jgi:glycosyltransferase involved in cell wall biosynthesis
MAVVHNGLDFSEWRPSERRQNEIICVGRAAPEKGIKEAAEAVISLLGRQPSWSARFILSESQRFPGYLRAVLETLRSASDRITVELNKTLPEVRERLQKAAIAIVPSRWDEPFGRTALEAHAAGCAVISSGTGGLKEVSGSHAIYLPQGFAAQDIVDCLERLVGDEEMRTRLAREGRAYCMQKFALTNISGNADLFYEQTVERLKTKAA